MIPTLLLLIVGQYSTTELPLELKLMLANRQSLYSTAVIEWEYDGSTPNQTIPKTCFTSQYAGQDYLLVEHPPEDPKIVSERKGQPWAFSEYRILVKENGDRWSHVPGSVIGQLKEDSSTELFHVKDIRSIGLLPWVHEAYNAAELNALDLFERTILSEVEYFESRPSSPSVHEIVAHMNNGDELRWSLDARNAFALLECEKKTGTENGGTFSESAVLSYGSFDGRQFPCRIEFRANGDLRGAATVSHAEFDRPSHPRELSVGEALQMLPGTNIYRGAAAGWSGPLVFDGEEALPVMDAVAREKAGLLDTREFLTRVIRWEDDPKCAYPKSSDDYAGLVVVRRKPGLWEDYTRRFIRDNSLSITQTENAWTHLRNCQAKAHAYLDEHKKDLLEIREQRVKARAIVGSDESADVQRHDAESLLTALEDREAHLYGRIEAIFEKMLKPGLFRLLTAGQLRAAEERAKAASFSKDER